MNRIHSTTGLGLAGFFGSPVALAYLLHQDLPALGRPDLRRQAALWFAPMTLIWVYSLFSFPPDFLSQFIVYLPQTILWWIVLRHLFSGPHKQYRQSGGLFHSPWKAIGIGLCVTVSLNLILAFLSLVLWNS